MMTGQPVPTRPTGIDAVGNVARASHFCLFYEAKDDLLSVLVPFFKAGLENGDYCLWVAGKPLTPAKARQALAVAVPGLERYEEQGRIDIVSAGAAGKDGRDAKRTRRESLEEKLSHGMAVRFSAALPAVRAKHWNELTDYRTLPDGTPGHYPLLALCTYCPTGRAPLEIVDVVQNHEFVLVKRDGKWQMSESPGREHVRRRLESSRRSEQRYRSIVETSAEGVWITDAQGITTFANRQFAGMLGYTVAGLTGKPALDLVAPAGREAAAQRLGERRQGHRETTTDVRPMLRKDGGLLWASMAASSFADDKGSYTGSLAMVTDVTLLREAEEKREQLTAELAEQRDLLDIIMENTAAAWPISTGTSTSCWSTRLMPGAAATPWTSLSARTTSPFFPAP